MMLAHRYYRSFLFDELFGLFGEKRDHVEFRSLDPWYRFYFHTGEQFDYRPSVGTNAEIRRFSPDDVAGYAKLLRTSKAIFEIGFEKLADKPFSKFTTMLAQIPSLLRLKSYYSVAGIVNKYIKHPLCGRPFLSIHCWLAAIHSVLLDLRPFITLSGVGVFAMGGTGQLVSALNDLLRRVGVKVVWTPILRAVI